jgi:hypothetical protein
LRPRTQALFQLINQFLPDLVRFGHARFNGCGGVQAEQEGAARDSSLTSPENSAIRTFMKEVHLTRPELAFIVATRVMIGAGIALLLADRISGEQRKAIGSTLALVGLVTTIPAVYAIFCKRESVAD